MEEQILKEIRDILKQIERNTRPTINKAALEAKNFNTWLSQYDEETDISEPIPTDIDPMPYVPTQAASHEQVMEAQRKLDAWLKRHPEFDNNSNKYTNNSNEYQFKIE